MTKNTGLSYELITRQIFEHILNQNSVHTIEAKHNVTIQGKVLKHQIDVYWEFEIGVGLVYKTIVQCKDWSNNPVKQEHLLAFKAILDDLPSQPRGIYVTRKGYQSGAQEFAKAHGILLYELNEPTWENTLKSVEIDMTFFYPKLTDFKFNQDMDWLLEQKKKQGTEKTDPVAHQVTLSSEQIAFFDESGHTIKLREIMDDWVTKASYQEIELQPVVFAFDKPTFMNTNSPTIPVVKLNSVEAKLSMTKSNDQLKINGPEIIAFILKNVLENTEVKIDRSLKPILI